MRNLDICDRCEGSGADPQQTLFVDEVTPCVGCFGDGYTAADEVLIEMPLRLSA